MKHKNNSNTYTLGTTGAFTPPSNLSSAPFKLDGFVVYNNTGGSATATFIGWLTIQNASNAPFVVGVVPTGMSSVGTTGWTTGVNTNGAANNSVEVSVQWASALVSNSITAMLFFERVI